MDMPLPTGRPSERHGPAKSSLLAHQGRGEVGIGLFTQTLPGRGCGDGGRGGVGALPLPSAHPAARGPIPFYVPLVVSNPSMSGLRTVINAANHLRWRWRLFLDTLEAREALPLLVPVEAVGYGWTGLRAIGQTEYQIQGQSQGLW